MKDTRISPLESEWNMQILCGYLGITEEVKNKRSKQHNWIQPSFKAHKHSPMDYKYAAELKIWNILTS